MSDVELRPMEKITVLAVQHDPLDFPMPEHACDCHTHIFGPHRDFPFSKNRKYTPNEALLSDLIKLHDALNLKRVVIVHPSPYASDNACTLSALKQLKQRGRGIVVIDRDTSQDQLLDMHEHGVRGVRINLQTEGILDLSIAKEQIEWNAKKVKTLGWHIQLFTQLDVIASLSSCLTQIDCSFVIDHFGLINPHLGLKQKNLDVLFDLLAKGNVWLKLSAAHRISQNPDASQVTQLAQALIQANPNRMVWGSDWPHPGGQPGARNNAQVVEPFAAINDGLALKRLHRWAQDAVTLEKILSLNPENLYDF